MPIDYKKYPPNWKEIVARIKARDGHKCAFCGVPNYAIGYRLKDANRTFIQCEGHEGDAAILDGRKLTKIVLTVAHLDHDSENWDVQDNRLAALCQSCHLKYDMWRHVRKRKYGYDVFKQPKLDL